MADTTVDVIDELKLALNDKDGAILSDAEYKRFILKHVYIQNVAYSFQHISGNFFAYRGYFSGYNSLAGLGGSSHGGRVYIFNPVLTTGEAGRTYTINCTGSIEQTAGATATVTQHTVTGALVDFDELMVELCTFLAQHKAQEMAQSIGDGNLSPDEVHHKLMEMAQYHRGVVSFG